MSHCPWSAHISIYHSCWAVGLGCLVSFGAGAPDASECVLDPFLLGKGHDDLQIIHVAYMSE